MSKPAAIVLARLNGGGARIEDLASPNFHRDWLFVGTKRMGTAMTSKPSEKAFQFAVVTPGNATRQKFLVDGSSEPIAERRLRRELPSNATVDFQRAANSDDIKRANLMTGGVFRFS